MTLINFKKITDLFKSKELIAKEAAIESSNINFYKSFNNDNIDGDILSVMTTYFKSGFRIESSHSKYIEGHSPFLYIWCALTNFYGKNIYYNLEKVEKINKAIFFVLEELPTEKYKNELHQSKILMNILINFTKESIEEQRENYSFYRQDRGWILKKYFFSLDVLKKYVDYTGFEDKENKKSFYECLESIVQNAFQQEKLNYEETNELNDFIHRLKTEDRIPLKEQMKSFELSKLSQVYGNYDEGNKEVINRESDNKNLLSMIKVLTLSKNDFNLKEDKLKDLFINILDNLNIIINNDKLEKNIEDKIHIQNLLHKHLPEMLTDYFELPLEYRLGFKDKEKKTPYSVFTNSLEEINEKIKTIVLNIHEENFIKIKVKNRFIKSF